MLGLYSICIELIIIDGKNILITREEIIEVQCSSNNPFFLIIYPTKININKTATCIKMLPKFIKIPPSQITLYTCKGQNSILIQNLLYNLIQNFK